MSCATCPVAAGPCVGTAQPHLCGLAHRPEWRRHILGASALLGGPPPPAPTRPPPPRDLLGLVRACPDRGGVLPMSLQDTSGCCGGGAELTECRAGRGRQPGRVSLRDCMACVAAKPRVTFRAQTSSWTGYGRILLGLGRALEDLGEPVAYEEVHRDERFLPVDPWVAARSGPAGAPAGWMVQAQEPYLGEPPPGVRKVSFSMGESDRISPAAAAVFNRAELVIVPCALCADAFAASGVTAPIRAVPLGLADPAAFAPKAAPPAGPARFGMAGRQEHGVARKNFAGGIEAFRRAFPRGDEPVRLDIRTAGSVPVDTRGDPRIAVARAGLTSAQLGDWYRTLDAYLCPSRGEGWGMHTLEAMGCGTPPIAALWGGTAEFADASTCYPVPFAMVPAGDDARLNAGRWCDPNVDALAARLREVAADRAGAFEVGRRAALRAHAFTWEASARAFLAALREFGLVP